jgi:hypothetical protein
MGAFFNTAANFDLRDFDLDFRRSIFADKARIAELINKELGSSFEVVELIEELDCVASNADNRARSALRFSPMIAYLLAHIFA